MMVRPAFFLLSALILTLFSLGIMRSASPWLWSAIIALVLLAGVLLIAPIRRRPSPATSFSAAEFRHSANLGAFLNKGLRDKVAEAIRIWQDCEELSRTSEEAGLAVFSPERVTIIREAVLNIYELASHLDTLKRHAYSKAQYEKLLHELKDWSQQIESAKPENEAARGEPRDLLEAKTALLNSQLDLFNTLEHAEREMDKVLAGLRSVDAEMRVTYITGRSYLRSWQELAQDLHKQIEDMREVQKALGGYKPVGSPIVSLPQEDDRS